MKRLLTNFKNVIKLVYTKKTKSFIKFLKGKNLYMQALEINSIFNISRADTIRFRRIVIDVLSESCAMPTDDEPDYEGIGTLAEKQMHAAIKRFICPDEAKHEIPLDNGERVGEIGEDGKKIKRRKFVADILNNGNVFEIQTGSLVPLHDKIDWILKNTSYNITVIHPIAETKWVNILNSQNDIEKRYKSPVKGRINDIASEIYSIKDFIDSPRFSLVLLMMEAEQYMKNTSKSTRSRKKFKKYELIPVNLISAVIFKGSDSYKVFIPESLEDEFTVKQFSSATKIRGMDAYSAVHSLCDIGLLEKCGNIGRAAVYKRCFDQK